jgi:hypothetical protein
MRHEQERHEACAGRDTHISSKRFVAFRSPVPTNMMAPSGTPEVGKGGVKEEGGGGGGGAVEHSRL